MLVLSRKQDQALVLTTPEGRRIRIVVAQADGKIRLGIEAGPEVNIVREELIGTQTERDYLERKGEKP